MVRSPRPETMSLTGLPVAGLRMVFFWRFGIWRRFVFTLLWLTFRPVNGVFPVIMHILDITEEGKNNAKILHDKPNFGKNKNTHTLGRVWVRYLQEIVVRGFGGLRAR